MKRQLLSMVLSAGVGMGVQAAEYQYLVFTLADGSTQSIAANGVTMTVADGTMTVTNGSNTLTLPTAQLTKMEFSNDDSAGIVTVGADDTGVSDGKVYDLQGRRMTQSFDSLPKGVYIINGKKVTKK